MVMSNPWTLLLLAISAEVIGTSCLRLSEGMTRPLPTLLVFSAYALAMALLSKVVLSIPLGITYALWSGIGTEHQQRGQWSCHAFRKPQAGGADHLSADRQQQQDPGIAHGYWCRSLGLWQRRFLDPRRDSAAA